jgi:dipeptidase E
MAMKHVVALGGGGFLMEPENPLLDDYILSLASRPRPRILFVPTASGDSPASIVSFYKSFPARRCEPTHLELFRRSVDDLRDLVLGQDIVYVGGGNTANMLAVWRVHGLDAILRDAWNVGVVLAGVSAGALCWFDGGVTDSFGIELAPLRGGLGLVSGTFVPHYDGEVRRRASFHRHVARGLPAGYGADDGVALHFSDAGLAAVVSSRPHARAYEVALSAGGIGVVETPIAPRYLGNGAEL